MDSIYDLNLIPRLVFSSIAVAIAVGPMFADFNRTHATNPLWTPHARFHVVWQVLSQAGVSCVILTLLWLPSQEYLTHLLLAAALNFVWIISFYCTLATMPLYGGALKDENGIKPFRFNIAGHIYLVDTNLFGGTLLMFINIGGVLAVTTGS